MKNFIKRILAKLFPNRFDEPGYYSVRLTAKELSCITVIVPPIKPNGYQETEIQL